MHVVIELISTVLLAFAAAVMSHFGVVEDRPARQQTTVERVVVSTPSAPSESGPRSAVECPEARAAVVDLA